MYHCDSIKSERGKNKILESESYRGIIGVFCDFDFRLNNYSSDKVPLTNQQAFLSLYHAIHERSTKMFAGRTVRGVGNGHIGIDRSDQFVGEGLDPPPTE